MVSDSLLIVGTLEPRLMGLLSKFGYSLIKPDAKNTLASIVASQLVDLILVGSDSEKPEASDPAAQSEGVTLCEYFRNDDHTKQVPIVFLADTAEQVAAIAEAGLANIEIIEPPRSIGSVTARIATQLRLRKFAGQDNMKASLAEMNIALRDLNERFREEREQAREIQESLLPRKLPAGPLFEMAAEYKPLDEVGGDWYFTNVWPDGSISVLICDVTGHGLSAAFVGSMTKLALSAAGKRPPHELLKEINRLMAPLLPEGRFITMSSYQFNPDSGVLEFARAGHPPGLLLKRAQKKVLELKSNGFAIGFFEDSQYQALQDKLDKGDVFILLTDGISEAQNRNMDTYGFEPIKKVLLESDEASSAEDIKKMVMDHFSAYTSERALKDDVTLLVLKRLG